MKINFKKTERQFTNDVGEVVKYIAREIIIDDMVYPVVKNKKDIFDFQFKELINKGE